MLPFLEEEQWQCDQIFFESIQLGLIDRASLVIQRKLLLLFAWIYPL